MGYKRYDETYIVVNNEIIVLTNTYGYFSAQFVKSTNLPIGRLNDNWMSKSQCKAIKKPVNEEEVLNGLVGFCRAMHGYYGLYYRELTDEDKEILKKKRR